MIVGLEGGKAVRGGGDGMMQPDKGEGLQEEAGAARLVAMGQRSGAAVGLPGNKQ